MSRLTVKDADRIPIDKKVFDEISRILTMVYVSERASSLDKEFLRVLLEQHQHILNICTQAMAGNNLEGVKRLKFLSVEYAESDMISEGMSLKEAKDLFDVFKEDLRDLFLMEIKTV